MKALSVIELSNLYGMTRQAIYKQVNKGNLTKNSDGKIDLAEAIRVFGEPSQRVNGLQATDTQKLSGVHLLEQQVNMLQKQLEFAQEREHFQREELKAKNSQLQAKDEQIESLQRLLGAPKEPSKDEPLVEYSKEPVVEAVNVAPQPTPNSVSAKPESKHRGLFNRMIRAVLD